MDITQIRKALKNGKSIYDMPLRVTFYARVSSEKDEQLNSLENQIIYYKNLIQSNSNWTYVDGYIDEGISGISTAKREKFNDMIRDAKNGMFDYIITKEISRFARNTLDSLKYTRELLDNGVCVFFQNDNINTIDTDSELRLTIMSSIAQDEVRKLSERIKFGHAQSIKNGVVIGNSRIFGYKKDNGKLVIDEKQVNFVKELFLLYSTGNYSMSQLETLFYEKGYRNYNGNKIAHTTMSNIIRNPKYKGYYCGNKVKNVDLFSKKREFLDENEWVMYKDETGETVPAIVSEELWEQANAVLVKRSEYMKNRKNTTYKHNLFTGKIYCKKHNTPFYKKMNRRKDKNISYDPYWVCSHKVNNGADSCPTFNIYESELLTILSDIIKEIVPNVDKYIDDYLCLLKKVLKNTDTQEKIQSIKNQMNIIRNKKDKLLDLCMDGSLSNSEFKSRNETLNKEYSDLEQELYNLECQEESFKNIQQRLSNLKIDIKTAYEQQQTPFTKKIIDMLFDKIYIDVDGNDVILDVYLNFHDSVQRIYTQKDLRSLGHTTKKICLKKSTSIMRCRRTCIGHFINLTYKCKVYL